MVFETNVREMMVICGDRLRVFDWNNNEISRLRGKDVWVRMNHNYHFVKRGTKLPVLKFGLPTPGEKFKGMVKVDFNYSLHCLQGIKLTVIVDDNDDEGYASDMELE